MRDKATNAREIRGSSPFYLEGRGMTFGGAGETLNVKCPNSAGELVTLTHDVTFHAD